MGKLSIRGNFRGTVFVIMAIICTTNVWSAKIAGCFERLFPDRGWTEAGTRPASTRRSLPWSWTICHLGGAQDLEPVWRRMRGEIMLCSRRAYTSSVGCGGAVREKSPCKVLLDHSYQGLGCKRVLRPDNGQSAAWKRRKQHHRSTRDKCVMPGTTPLCLEADMELGCALFPSSPPPGILTIYTTVQNRYCETVPSEFCQKLCWLH